MIRLIRDLGRETDAVVFRDDQGFFAKNTEAYEMKNL